MHGCVYACVCVCVRACMCARMYVCPLEFHCTHSLYLGPIPGGPLSSNQGANSRGSLCPLIGEGGQLELFHCAPEHIHVPQLY